MGRRDWLRYPLRDADAEQAFVLADSGVVATLAVSSAEVAEAAPDVRLGWRSRPETPPSWRTITRAGPAAATDTPQAVTTHLHNVSPDELLSSWNIATRHVQMNESVSTQQRNERVLDDAIVTPDWTFDHLRFPDVLDLLQDGALFSFGVRGVSRTFRLTNTDVGWTLLRNDEDSGSAAGSPSSAQAR